jgi:hypothetical protein
MGTRKLTAALAAFIALLGAGSDAGEVFQIPFTTDLDYFGDGVYGPDGPWQAAAIMLGTHQRKGLAEHFTDGPRVPMWPTGLTISQLLTTEAGGEYNRTAEARAAKPWGEFGDGGENIMRAADLSANHYSEGVGVVDGITLVNMRFEEPGYANVDATIYAMLSSWVTLSEGRRYTSQIGNLGLGRPNDTSASSIIGSTGTSMIEQMKSAGLVTSNSFGLHMGSAALGQRGSLIIGGYEDNRVLGEVGVFSMILGTPVIFLVDVTIGVETGRWPFNTSETDMGRIWESTTDQTGLEASSLVGGKLGSVLVSPNPAVPGIYLPGPTCANAAKHLPVKWDDTLGYYLWDTQDPIYWSIVNSGAFIAFVLSDSQVMNVTIKVPFKLLNLTLESPIVDTPIPYFPCFDTDGQSAGVWELGRAFLQAAFFGVNYDQNVTFLAQAPGPSMEQSVIQTIKQNDKTLATKSISSFADSWRSQWPALDSASPVTASSSNPALSPGAIAGIAVGAVAGLALLTFTGYFLWRKREQTATREPAELDTEDNKSSQEVQEADGRERKHVHEMGESMVMELDSASTMVQEIDSPMQEIYEAPDSSGVCEMLADPFIPRESRQQSQE